MITALLGIGMLITNQSSPDPVSPAAPIVVAVAGLLLLIVGYGGMNSFGRPRRNGQP